MPNLEKEGFEMMKDMKIFEHFLCLLVSVICLLLSESDIFCLPSFSEGFSTSILEAIACKCFVVTTERGGAKETFPTDDYGMVIKNNNVDLLEHSLMKVIDDKEKREKAVQLAYDRLKENYTWDIVAAKVERL